MHSRPKLNSYINHLSSVSGSRDGHLLEAPAEALKKKRDSGISHQQEPAVTYLVDFTRKSYLFVHEGCSRLTGYKDHYFLKGGLDSFLSLYNTAHFDIYNKKIFPANLKFLKEHPRQQLSDLVFSHNYQIRNREGNEINILQRVSLIQGPSGEGPIGAVGSVTDITHFRNDQSSVHTIEAIRHAGGRETTSLLYKKVHFYDESLAAISRKEMEVLKWIGEGLGSKQIAEKLGLSIHTVHNHRRNMLHKTSCANTFELLNFAIKNKLM